MRWLPPNLSESQLDALTLPTEARIAYDTEGNPVVLFPSDWTVTYFAEKNQQVPLSSLPISESDEVRIGDFTDDVRYSDSQGN